MRTKKYPLFMDDDRHIGLLKKLLGIAASARGNKEVFHQKMMDALSISSLKETGILRLDESLPEEDWDRLSPQETELCSLLQKGFTSKEITVMLDLKHPRSIYVKLSRLNKKLKGEIAPEILLGILTLSVLAYVLIELIR